MTKGVDYIGVGVGALIINNEGKFFAALRGPQAKNERNTWEIPGGGVEFGETFRDAIVREIKEEIGVEIELGALLELCDHIIPDEHQHWVSPTYFARITSGEPIILEPEKCAAIGWFTLDEAEQLPLSIVTKHDIAALRARFPDGKIRFIAA